MGASVKIMLSYDYCHFEVALSNNDETLTLEQVDNMRKDCQRLADKAVRQYKVTKNAVSAKIWAEKSAAEIRPEVDKICEIPKSEWTPEQKATVKALEDHDFLLSHDWNYQDEWEERVHYED